MREPSDISPNFFIFCILATVLLPAALETAVQWWQQFRGYILEIWNTAPRFCGCYDDDWHERERICEECHLIYKHDYTTIYRRGCETCAAEWKEREEESAVKNGYAYQTINPPAQKRA